MACSASLERCADSLRHRVQLATSRSLAILSDDDADSDLLRSELELWVEEAGHLEMAVEEALEAAAEQLRTNVRPAAMAAALAAAEGAKRQEELRSSLAACRRQLDEARQQARQRRSFAQG